MINENFTNMLDSFADFVDFRQTSSYYWFTQDEYLHLSKVTRNAFNQAVYRLSRQRRILHIAKGFYIIVPLEYKEKGMIPTSWFIEPFMSHLGLKYYVSLLTAASFLGFAHQQPQQFQVLINKQQKLSLSKKTNINFIVKKNIDEVCFQQQKTDTGYFNIAKKESLVFDLVQYMHLCGNLSNVATIFYEIGNELDDNKLAEMYFKYAKTVTQRVGYILDFVGQKNKTEQLNRLLSTSKITNYVPISPGGETTGNKNRKWHIIINEQIETDL